MLDGVVVGVRWGCQGYQQASRCYTQAVPLLLANYAGSPCKGLGWLGKNRAAQQTPDGQGLSQRATKRTMNFVVRTEESTRASRTETRNQGSTA